MDGNKPDENMEVDEAETAGTTHLNHIILSS